jgi:hypothetical protein
MFYPWLLLFFGLVDATDEPVQCNRKELSSASSWDNLTIDQQEEFVNIHFFAFQSVHHLLSLLGRSLG